MDGRKIMAKQIVFNKQEQSFTYQKVLDQKNNSGAPEIEFKFIVERKKSAQNGRERLVITALDRDGKETGKISAAMPKLVDNLLSLREYGVIASRIVFTDLAKCIENNYYDLKCESFDDEGTISDEVLNAILAMVTDCIAEGMAFPTTIKGEMCYNIPVKEFQDLIRDSEYADIDLTELKRRLKQKGYAKCSTGRYDCTVKEPEKDKAIKVMSFRKSALPELPELPISETDG